MGSSPPKMKLPKTTAQGTDPRLDMVPPAQLRSTRATTAPTTVEPSSSKRKAATNSTGKRPAKKPKQIAAKTGTQQPPRRNNRLLESFRPSIQTGHIVTLTLEDHSPETSAASQQSDSFELINQAIDQYVDKDDVSAEEPESSHPVSEPGKEQPVALPAEETAKPTQSTSQESSSGSSFRPGETPQSSETSFADSAEVDTLPEYPRTRVELTEKLLKQMSKFTDKDITEKFLRRKGKEYKSGQRIDYSVLDKLGAKEQFLRYFDNIGFSWLLDQPDYEIPELVADEFFSSFHLDIIATSLDKLSVTFRLFNICYNMSLIEWSVRLGIVTAAEAAGTQFQTALRGIPGKNPLPFHPQQAWQEITIPASGKFKAVQSRAHHF